MSYRATTALLVAIAFLGQAVPGRTDDLRPAIRDPQHRPREGVSFALRGPLALAAGGAATLGGLMVIYAVYPGDESTNSSSVPESLFWLATLSVAAATAVYTVNDSLDGDWTGSYGAAIGGAALGTIVLAAVLSNTEGTAVALSLFAPPLGAVLGYEMTRRGPAWAVLTLDGSRLALGVPLPRARVQQHGGRCSVAFEAPLLSMRF